MSSSGSGLPADAMIVLDKVNTADRPETSIESVVDDMVANGAQLIFATSDDMKDGIEAAAAAHPDVPMIWSSGDSAWADGKAFRRPHQSWKHHGPDGVRQDDCGLRGCPDDRYWFDRLLGAIDQRRDPSPGQLRLPRGELLLGELPR